LIADSPLSQTKTIVSREMLNYNNGTFSGQESNEIEVKNKFRKGYAKEVRNLDDKKLIRAMKIFLNRFEDK